jgi:hypothetical protein
MGGGGAAMGGGGAAMGGGGAAMGTDEEQAFVAVRDLVAVWPSKKLRKSVDNVFQQQQNRNGVRWTVDVCLNRGHRLNTPPPSDSELLELHKAWERLRLLWGI